MTWLSNATDFVETRESIDFRSLTALQSPRWEATKCLLEEFLSGILFWWLDNVRALRKKDGFPSRHGDFESNEAAKSAKKIKK